HTVLPAAADDALTTRSRGFLVHLGPLDHDTGDRRCHISGDIPVGDVTCDGAGVPLQRIAVPAATVVGVGEQVPVAQRRGEVGAFLDVRRAVGELGQVRLVRVGSQRVRERLALGRALRDPGLVGRVVQLHGRCRVTAAHSGVVEDAAGVLGGRGDQLGGVVDQPQRLEPAATSVAAEAAGVRADAAAEVDHGHVLFPDLHVAHVGFGVPTDVGGVQAVLDAQGTAAGCRALEQGDAELPAVLTLATHLDHRAVDLADE